MKQVLFACLIFVGFCSFTQLVYATSQKAYQDYQFQYDMYRQRLGEYRIAKNEYDQFHSLASQQNALDKAKLLIAQQDNAAKTYFLFLNEKLNENPGIHANELYIYRAIITNQIGYLDQNVTLVPSAASLEDAAKISEAFASNYETMQSGYRQTIAVIELGYLDFFASKFNNAAIHAQSLIVAAKSHAKAEKQSVLDRWLLALSNKQSLYQQKSNTIRSSISKLTGDVTQQDRLFLQLQSKFAEAKQDLIEAASYLKEIEQALSYD